ncbi:hypothetical protein ABFT23_13345 [Nocardioides sp. C4-1]
MTIRTGSRLASRTVVLCELPVEWLLIGSPGAVRPLATTTLTHHSR